MYTNPIPPTDMTSGSVVIPNNKPNQCHFLVSRKHRCCALPARQGRRFCGEHASYDTSFEGNDDIRIPCPLNPAHTITKSHLEKHLARCNARIIETPARNLDVNIVRHLDPNHVHRPLHELSCSAIADLIQKVELAYDAMINDMGGFISTQVLDSPVLDELRQSKQNLKHVDQVASLIGHLENMGALCPSYIFVEFGAGKGILSHQVYRALKSKLEGDNTNTIPFYLVDRSNYRRKSDAYFPTERINLDIKDLHLSQVPSLRHLHQCPTSTDSSSFIQPIVGFSKHLCGGATDLTLKCLDRYVNDMATEAPGRLAVHSFVIALCCHHRCTFDTYIGDTWLANFGMSPNDIPALSNMTSWATCGIRPKTSGDTIKSQVNVHNENINEIPKSHYSGLDHSIRTKLGDKAKRVLDYGRVMYLRNLGIDAQLLYYVDPATSLENCALIAKYPQPTA